MVAAVRRCYHHAALPWPDQVIWAPSPPAGQLLAAGLSRQHTIRSEREQAWRTLARRSIGPVVAGLIEYGIAAAVSSVLLAVVIVGGPVMAVVEGQPVEWMARGTYVGAVVAALLAMATFALIRMDDTNGTTGDLTVKRILTAIKTAGRNGVAEPPTVRTALDEIADTSKMAGMAMLFTVVLPVPVGMMAGWAVGEVTGWNGRSAVAWVVTMLVVTLVPAVVASAVAGGVFRWRLAGLRMRCADPAQERLGSRLDDALRTVRAAIPARRGLSSPGSDVDDRARPVHQAIEKAVHQHVGTDRQVLRYPVGHFDNQYSDQLDRAVSHTTYDHPEQDTAVTVIRDFITASRAGWWWPHTRFVVIAERPTTMRTTTGPPHIRPDDSVHEKVFPWRRSPPKRQPLNRLNSRLHSTVGPAAAWPDGYRIYAVDGIMVPADLVEDGWDADTIDRHPDSDVRRAATELVGWMNYIQRAGWRAIADAPDPADPSCGLVLYEDRRPRLSPLRVLVTTGGTTDSAEPVPATINDPVEAAAWRHGCPVSVYRQQTRIT
ncbi:hypothetical protein Q0Z83_042300 [Actinoplanes sichuanensis]|uniref:DUF6745 domain-containing protein n=1 Tax=Actinoplanes sichuanensis TaxID=512349 RepID=A0ABW4AVL5_9ACTN|nr:hypothetical protein [Actinoplanes sichuanensis]BEL06039.1 hypothetical protein Q0Z83_042300 [Actinoplanes sichuanensis]